MNANTKPEATMNEKQLREVRQALGDVLDTVELTTEERAKLNRMYWEIMALANEPDA
jgi:hypothetical protein